MSTPAARAIFGGQILRGVNHRGHFIPTEENGKKLFKYCQVAGVFDQSRLQAESEYFAILDSQALDFVHPDIAYAGGVTGCKKIADYAALTRTPVALHNVGSLVLCYANAHFGAAIQNFYKLENGLGGGVKEKMAADNPPVVRKSQLRLPEGRGLGLRMNEDYLRERVSPGEAYWG